MKHKKIAIKYFIVISILIIGTLPTINFFQHVVKYDFKKIFNTEKIEMYVNYGFYKIFNQSLEQNSVITGKDDFLFLGGKYDNVLHKTNGIFRPTNTEINKWTDKLKNIQAWYEARGIKFTIVIAPNKHTIYREKLPNWMRYDGGTVTDDIVRMSNKKNINLVDLRKFFISQKSDEKLLYNKFGTHWNRYGASLGYNETIEHINQYYKSNIKKTTYKVFDNLKGHDRGLIRFLKLKEQFSNIYENEYTFNLKNKLCYGDIDKKTFILDKCKIVNNPTIKPNKKPSYIINAEADNNETLLLLGDSYMGANSKLYNSTFSKVFRWHDGGLNGKPLSDFILKNKPSIVIYQLVERRLYNNGIVKKLPDS